MGSRYDDAFVFAFVRDPRDRLLSAYSYLTQQTPENVACPEYWEFDRLEREFVNRFESFEDFVLNMPTTIARAPQFQHFIAQPSLLALSDGVCGCTKLFRYEQWDESLEQLSELMGVNLDVPQFNGSQHADWRDVYTAGMEDRVKQIYWVAFEILGYE